MLVPSILRAFKPSRSAGKSVKSAIDAGYARATITIVDANLTTLIAALVLLRFGTGPIRGFAVVLSLGIIVSFFTAIFVTKIIFDYLVVVKKVKTVKI
jgi:preprotein translocase subunit SecD